MPLRVIRKSMRSSTLIPELVEGSKRARPAFDGHFDSGTA
jgi:hypothetical protein